MVTLSRRQRSLARAGSRDGHTRTPPRRVVVPAGTVKAFREAPKEALRSYA
jgi:hypothetical protein